MATLIVGIAATVTAPAEAADGFLSLVEDLPLAPGLSENADAGVSFDNAGGRIVEAYAHGQLAKHQVLDFYKETLPQLGWTLKSPTEYDRSGERLRLELIDGSDGLTVHYSLSPQ